MYFVISFLLSKSMDVKNVENVFFISLFIAIYLGGQYYIWNNKNIYVNCFIVILGISTSIFINLEELFYSPLSAIEGINYHDLLIISIIFILISMISSLSGYVYKSLFNSENKIVAEIPFIESRKNDLQRLTALIKDKHIGTIGIEADWGTGKTYTLKKTFEILKCEDYPYEEVNIDILATNMDNILDYLVNELNDVLKRNNIISVNADFLKTFSDNNLLSEIYNIMKDSPDTYSEKFNKFREELRSIDKTIIIVIEDIDRINDVEKIKKLLYLGEKISEADEYNDYQTNIKIIYQYSHEHIVKLDLSWHYIEKYIQEKMRISKLEFRDIIQYYLDYNFKNNTNFNPKFLQDVIYELPPHILKIHLDEGIDDRNIHKYFSDKVNFRLIGNYLYYLNNLIIANNNSLLYLNAKEREKEEKLYFKIIFIQCFMPELYSKINTNIRLVDNLLFKYEDKIIPISLVLEDIKREKYRRQYNLLKIIYDENNKENLEKYIIYKMLKLGYVGEEVELNRENLYTRNYKEISENEQLDYKDIERIVYNLIEGRQSSRNDYVNAAYKFNELVLKYESCDEQYNNIQVFNDYMYNCNNGNRTVMRMAMLFWVPIFMSYYYAREKWNADICNVMCTKCIKLYFYELEFKEKQNILKSNIIIEMYYWFANVCNNEILAITVEGLNKLKYSKNPKSIREFYLFLREFLNMLIRLGWIDYDAKYRYIEDINEDNNDILRLLDQIKNDIINIYSQIERNGKFVKRNDLYNNIIIFITNIEKCLSLEDLLEDTHSHRINISASTVREGIFARAYNMSLDEIVEYDNSNMEIRTTDLLTVLREKNKN